ncbi:uncharacterized protein MELLADRAFT_109706 [Melampsora larici-populina 98AG31]|uniref:Wax synthase domain-containing protein n=1 Tax=Melampsora larici-populina (strain 98AG31 / pathotype 3-4-7) TaxID=747676 RepID=F4RXC7_MELLP|nr:uncharacterized protein MELLADRAFT_109706 [Melampsora larici-populina 98AG31]EGG03008.1 hypothetical protein MELLADRAFT_109706 [Melampsora larici-populina 98AG31]
MHIFLTFAVAQLPLLVQAFLLHPHYQSNSKARLIRLALVPIGVWSLFSFGSQWRKTLPGWINPSANKNFGQFLIVSALRCMTWGTTSTPYYRLSPSGPPKKAPEKLSKRLWFALELFCNFRGIGWSFGVPIEAQIQTNTEFLRATYRRLFINAAVFLTSLELLALLKDSPYYGMFPFSYLKGLLAMPFFWVMIDSLGCLPRFMATIFRLDKNEYPFFLNSALKSSSLTELWSRRWHSCLRHTLIEAGARPAYRLMRFVGQPYLSGRTNEIAQAVGTLSAFLMSGLVHEFGLWYSTHLDRSFRSTTFFLAQGVGILLEEGFNRMTGRRVGGWPGWTFVLIWIIFWIRPMVDAYVEHGMINLDQLPTVIVDHILKLTTFHSLHHCFK